MLIFHCLSSPVKVFCVKSCRYLPSGSLLSMSICPRLLSELGPAVSASHRDVSKETLVAKNKADQIHDCFYIPFASFGQPGTLLRLSGIHQTYPAPAPGRSDMQPVVCWTAYCLFPCSFSPFCCSSLSQDLVSSRSRSEHSCSSP